MHAQLLIDNIVRQTTVLIAQLSTAAGLRAPLSQVADQVFLELSRELASQRVRQKVAADMFGMALRSYQMKVRRLSELGSEQPATLWQGIHARLAQGSVTRPELEAFFKTYPRKMWPPRSRTWCRAASRTPRGAATAVCTGSRLLPIASV